jgi:uncharacterized protein
MDPLREQPVTVMIERYVTRGREFEFQAWNEKLEHILSEYPGCLGTGLLHPNVAGQPWHLVYRFATAQQLRDWEESGVRAALMEQARPFVESTTVHRVTGLETWFSLPGHLVEPPPRWKMFIVSSAVFYILSLTLNSLYGSVIRNWSTPLRVLFVSYPVTAIATWLVMPLAARTLRRWLYAPAMTTTSPPP